MPTLAASPPLTLGPFRGPKTTIEEMRRAATGVRGERSVRVRSFTERIIRGLQPKDYLGEILAIRHAAAEYCRYTNDPISTEWVKDPERIVEEIEATGKSLTDCFPSGTLLLSDAYDFIPVEILRPGMKIWGLDKWSTVEATAYKGMLPVDMIRLNNGSQVMLTPDHHVYVLRCPRHHAAKTPCYCPTSEREEQRVSVAELDEGMVLTMPERIPFGSESGNPDRAYVEGLYVSDGWSSHNTSFCISGQDGCAKEAQKAEVRDICTRLGINTTWYRKSIDVQDADWTLRMHQMGTHAPDKHLLSIDLNESMAVATLRGVMADSGANTKGAGTRTFTSTSRQLMLQTRVLHKMFGITCGYSYIENHGGLGRNPIWRLSTRARSGERQNQEKLLRVKRIERQVLEVPCWDIQTDDHRVYLPEHDVTVSNCDEIACFIATMCRQVGREAEYVTVGFGEPGHYSHVFARVKEPKSGQWIVCDPVAGTTEERMLGRVKTYQFWRLD